MKHIITSLLLILTLSSLAVIAQTTATLRDVEVNKDNDSKPIPKMINDDIKVKRNYPMQPPIIPHNIRDYQVNIQVNKCLSCHSRKRTEDSQATMISVTHYMDRDGNFLADVSPRRYFCDQCHVAQADTKALVDNDFEDIDEILKKKLSETK